ncbi:MAG: nuclear transport factor 2 family protein [Bacteroidota bacterium]
MKRLVAIVFVGGMVLTTVAEGGDVDDIKAATLEHFATLNAGDAADHVRHHLAVHSGFPPDGGLLDRSDSRKDQENSLQADFDAGLKTNLQLRHLEVKVYGNTAVVTGYVVGTVTSADGTTQQVTTRRSAVLIKEGGQWMEAHVHSSPLIASPPQ